MVFERLPAGRQVYLQYVFLHHEAKASSPQANPQWRRSVVRMSENTITRPIVPQFMNNVG